VLPQEKFSKFVRFWILRRFKVLAGCSPDELAFLLRQFPERSADDFVLGNRSLYGAGPPGTLDAVRRTWAVQAERHLAAHLSRVRMQLASQLSPEAAAPWSPLHALVEEALRRPSGPSVVVFVDPASSVDPTSASPASPEAAAD
jgi:hypothetical protein